MMPDDLSPLWVSLKTAFAATLMAFVLGIAVARWMVSYRGRARGLIDGILTLPLVLPPTVVGFLLLLLLGKNSPVGEFLDQLGLSIIFTWAAAVIASTVVAFPLMYKTVLGSFEQVDLTLVSSARTLGASEWRIFWQILLPLAGPGVLAGTILAFARALGEFGATLMVGGSIRGVTQTIPIAIFFAAEAGRMGVALAWVLLMIVISLAVIAGINYGNSPQFHTRTRPHPLTKRWFNWLYFGTPNSGTWSASPSILPGYRHPPRSEAGLFPSHTFSPGASHRVDQQPAIVGAIASPREMPNSDTAAVPRPAYSTTPHPIPQVARQSGLQPSLDAAPWPSPTASELAVKIEKQVPGFHLKVNFRTDQAPLGLLGTSGSGKSMTLRCIAGLETPSRGRIVLNGRVLFDSNAKINVPSRDRKVGLVFQNYALFPHLTVAQNIAFGMGHIPKAKKAEEVVHYLEIMQLSGLGDRYPQQLSGGQQQRVALARALAIQPDILLLDEPLSALDTYLRSHVEKLLIDVLSTYNGITLFITHKLEEAYRVCRNLLILAHGEILAEGTKEEIFEHPPNFQVARVTECKNFSRVRVLDPYRLDALDWGCQLAMTEPVPPETSYLGLRAHHIRFPGEANQPNTFPGWLAMSSETQHRVTLYIKLHQEPVSPQDYHLQVEVYREKWESLKTRPFPWHIRLDPARLITMPC
jgi:molybdate transport system permease protein